MKIFTVYISNIYTATKNFIQKKIDLVICTVKNTAHWISSDGDLMTKLLNHATFLNSNVQNNTLNRLDFLVPIFFKTIQSFSSTFQGKFPISKADWKIKHFSRQHSNSSTFQGLWEPWWNKRDPWLWTQRAFWKNNPTKSPMVWNARNTIYRKISNIRCAKSPNLNVSRPVLQLSLPDPMKPGVESRMKM